MVNTKIWKKYIYWYQRLIERGEEVIGLARTTKNSDLLSIECDVSEYSSVKNAAREVKKLKKQC